MSNTKNPLISGFSSIWVAMELKAVGERK